MATGLTALLVANPIALGMAVIADLAIGDPVYRLHPVRLIGDALTFTERALRSVGAHGYGGGVALFAILCSTCVAVATAAILISFALTPWLAWIVHTLVLYSLLALGDLLRHVWRVEAALIRADIKAARYAVAMLVGRDTDRMDRAACRRAAIESVSENLPDGFTSALFWYVVGGLPALVVFKA
jgi:adenosylcobinamide-phosphate synthase